LAQVKIHRQSAPEAKRTRQPATAKLTETAGRNLHERIANALGEQIVAGRYKPGGTLPTEIDLRNSLAVSRSALREAFKLLAAKGLIVSRQKIGTLVRPRADWNMLDPEVLAWHLRAAPTDAFVTGLFEARMAIEPSACALAAERRSDAALLSIETALAEMFAAQGGKGDLIGADARFHQGILDATGNYFFSSFGAVIESSLQASFRLSWGAKYTPEYSLRQHEGVARAIRERNGAEAHAVMTQLLRSAIEDIRVSLARRQEEADAAPA
jgi:DNA-binding FadR family transcriptional regulator